MSAEPRSERDFAAVLEQVRPEAERLIAQYPVKRSALLPILHAFQNVEGWVSPEALATTARMLDEPLSIVESTATFYTLFFRKPIGRYLLQPCRGIACVINGAEETMRHFRERLGIAHLETTSDGLFSYEEVECLAACDRAPCMQVNLEFVYNLTPEKIDMMLAEMRAGRFPVRPIPQNTSPGRTWHVEHAPPTRSSGAQNVVDADSPGGIGDRSGAEMLKRLVNGPRLLPSDERALRDGKTLLEELERGSS